MTISIRAHHLLCTSLFSGHGYSDSFTEGLLHTVEFLHNGENHTIILLDEPDRICAGCPKRIMVTQADPLAYERAERRASARQDVISTAGPENTSWTGRAEEQPAADGPVDRSLPGYPEGRALPGCAEEHNHVVLTDHAVLDALHLEIGKAYSWQMLLERILALLDEQKFERICGGCRWYRQGLCSHEALQKRVKELSARITG